MVRRRRSWVSPWSRTDPYIPYSSPQQTGKSIPDPCLVTSVLLKESKIKILWILVTLKVSICRCPGSNSSIWCLVSQEGTVNLVHSHVPSAFKGCDQLSESCSLQAPSLKCVGWHCRFVHSQWDLWRTILRWWWRSSVSKPAVWEVVEIAWKEGGGGGQVKSQRDFGEKHPCQNKEQNFKTQSKTSDC